MNLGQDKLTSFTIRYVSQMFYITYDAREIGDDIVIPNIKPYTHYDKNI